ncbi:MAG: DUF2461 domain-containing protein [Rhodobacterales bacterium]|nr:DUF2461 domain-containing protein [Rhodobacterales bacterium]
MSKGGEIGPFAGFGPGFFGFFRDLAANNDRDWFTAHKDRYRAEVVDPMVRFIAAMGPRLEAVSPHFVADPRPNGGSMFRIHRDVRFSKDKRPYKEHGACQFRHAAGRDAHAPGYYVHLAPDEVVFGGGIWLPPAPALATIREAIRDRPEAWAAAAGDGGLKAVFGGVAGQSLTRPPRGFTADDPHIDDIKRKSFFAMRHTGPDLAGSAAFADEVAAAFAAATPLMRFLTDALDQPY